jgi:N-methylhydantoinase A/oxoprolinase/acetone carboxylase beta subunit
LNRKIKIGIDVGGTFTHAVAIDIADFSIVGKACVPTTHTADEGVAKGVVDSMLNLIKESKILPQEVKLIAHSTTQATNALLEGDVAKVGVIGLGKGIEKSRVKKETNLFNIQLATNKLLPIEYEFLDSKEDLTELLIKNTIEKLIKRGAEVIVASEAFGIDDCKNEDKIIEIAEKWGFRLLRQVK